MKNNVERIMECLACEFFEKCEQEIEDPEEYEDGSCKQRDTFKKNTRRKDECSDLEERKKS